MVANKKMGVKTISVRGVSWVEKQAQKRVWMRVLFEHRHDVQEGLFGVLREQHVGQVP